MNLITLHHTTPTSVETAQAPTEDSMTPEKIANALVPANKDIAALLETTDGYDLVAKDGSGYEKWVEIWHPPAQVKDAHLPALHAQQKSLMEVMQPVERNTLSSMILTLQSHYPSKDSAPVTLAQALYEDWLDDLGEFPRWAIAEASRRWRRHPTKYRFRPMPNDIRLICQEVVEKHAESLRRIAILIAKAMGEQCSQTLQHENVELDEEPAMEPLDLRTRIIKLAAAKRLDPYNKLF